MILSALIASLLLPPPQTAPQTPASPLPDVVVEGRVLEGEALEDLARDFIGEVTAPPRGVSAARWADSVCVGVINFEADAAQFVVDRVSSVAVAAGLRAGEPGCSPQVVIIGTLDGAGVARGLVERRGRTFNPGGDDYNLGRAALSEFMTGDRPVRWWHVSTAVEPDTGQRATRQSGGLGFGLDPETGLEGLRIIRDRNTLLAEQTRQDLTRAIVIVDFDQLDGVDFDQLADYLAFVSLSQVDPEADTSQAPTILNLFDDPLGTPGLTEWDRAYLRGLYNSDAAAPTAIAREGAIRREMLRARASDPATEAD